MVHATVDDSDFSEIRLLFLHSQTRRLVSVSVLLFGSCQLNQFHTNSEAAKLSNAQPPKDGADGLQFLQT